MIARGRNSLLVICGSVFLALGIVGVVVPVLPTTPFLLLAAACYARGSRRLHDALMRSRFPGRYIRDYREGKGLTRSAKAVLLFTLWLTIGYSALAVVEGTLLQALLFAIATAVSIHLLALPTRRR
ncbi:MAG: YbaN family protein [Anaerolineae bacterium]